MIDVKLVRIAPPHPGVPIEEEEIGYVQMPVVPAIPGAAVIDGEPHQLAACRWDLGLGKASVLVVACVRIETSGIIKAAGPGLIVPGRG